MKKLIILIFWFLPHIFYAQETIECFLVQKGHRRSDLQSWKWKKCKECNVTFQLSGYRITSNNKSFPVINTYETLTNNDLVATWSAKDHLDRDCIVKMEFEFDYFNIVITYPKRCYKYRFNT
jgi:hypothetical protein